MPSAAVVSGSTRSAASSPFSRRYGVRYSMLNQIVLAPLDRTGPTLWSHMRLCALRGALSTSHAANTWVLHDPRVWLGTAFHRVMEVAARPDATDAAVEQAWTEAVAEAATAAAAHPLDARYSVPDRWPNYFLVRQRAMSSARSAIAANIGSKQGALRGGTSFTERLLVARGGRLAGRPDRFDGRVLTEYKSSIPDTAWRGAAAVLEGFRRQLRLYAAIIADGRGNWPIEGRVVAASGQTMNVPLEPATCEAEADAALAALDELNHHLAAGGPPEALAQPGEEACGGCPFQALCPAFWPWLAASGSERLPETAAAGMLDRIELGQDGDLYTAYLAVHQPAMPPGLHPLVLRRSIHGDLTASSRGAKWRVVSANLKPDGRLRADLSTCVFSLDDLPDIVASNAPAGAIQPRSMGN
ncbi:PD-(D/E)XK nuclease family protein [Mesorhizobium shangrilense]|uniref:PD-(D/E)XK nuclease family protein n=1 Tax=Mesorhizobium shangrilense TaxID=460060 RepID=A0ABV2DIB8_9HYPH